MNYLIRNLSLLLIFLLPTIHAYAQYTPNFAECTIHKERTCKLYNCFFDKDMEVNNMIVVLPAREGIESFTMFYSEKNISGQVSGGEISVPDAICDAIEDKTYLDAVALSPVPKYVKYLDVDRFIWSFNPKNWLWMPKDMYRFHLEDAIDLTGDGMPNIITFHYCCGKPMMDVGWCDGICFRIYYRESDDEEWQLLSSRRSC